jgi:hypothetical protein
MKLLDKVTIPLPVTARLIGDETVILNLESGTYYGLDPVGARMWELMTQGKTLDGICEVMQEEYEVERGVLEEDVMGLARDLARQGLIIPVIDD